MSMVKFIIYFKEAFNKKTDYFMTMGQFHLTPSLNYEILIYENLDTFPPPHFDKLWQKIAKYLNISLGFQRNQIFPFFEGPHSFLF